MQYNAKIYVESTLLIFSTLLTIFKLLYKVFAKLSLVFS